MNPEDHTTNFVIITVPADGLAPFGTMTSSDTHTESVPMGTVESLTILTLSIWIPHQQLFNGNFGNSHETPFNKGLLSGMTVDELVSGKSAHPPPPPYCLSALCSVCGVYMVLFIYRIACHIQSFWYFSVPGHSPVTVIQYVVVLLELPGPRFNIKTIFPARLVFMTGIPI